MLHQLNLGLNFGDILTIRDTKRPSFKRWGVHIKLGCGAGVRIFSED